MFALKTFALCAVLACAFLSTSAEAQQINVQSNIDSGTSAGISRVRSFGDSQSQTWYPSYNTNCGNVSIASTGTDTSPSNMTASAGGLPAGDPNDPFSTTMPANAAVQSGPLKQDVATGSIYNVCFKR